MAIVHIKIDGRTYRMACDSGQEDTIQDLAHLFEQYIAYLRTQFGKIGEHQLAVMAGMMVVDEKNELEKKINNLYAEIAALKIAYENEKFQNSEKEICADIIERAAIKIEELALKLSKAQIPLNKATLDKDLSKSPTPPISLDP